MQCTICDSEQDNGDINCHTSQTIQPLHKRVNDHQSCFDGNENLQIWGNQHCPSMPIAYESHQDNFDIRNFKIMDYRQGLEANTINELRLGVLKKNDFCAFFQIFLNL